MKKFYGKETSEVYGSVDRITDLKMTLYVCVFGEDECVQLRPLCSSESHETFLTIQ